MQVLAGLRSHSCKTQSVDGFSLPLAAPCLPVWEEKNRKGSSSEDGHWCPLPAYRCADPSLKQWGERNHHISPSGSASFLQEQLMPSDVPKEMIKAEQPVHEEFSSLLPPAGALTALSLQQSHHHPRWGHTLQLHSKQGHDLAAFIKCRGAS